MNFILVLIISIVLTVGVYLIHNKILKKETSKVTLLKLVSLGLLLSVMNYLIMKNSNTSLTKLLGELETGNATFKMSRVKYWLLVIQN